MKEYGIFPVRIYMSVCVRDNNIERLLSIEFVRHLYGGQKIASHHQNLPVNISQLACQWQMKA